MSRDKSGSDLITGQMVTGVKGRDLYTGLDTELENLSFCCQGIVQVGSPHKNKRLIQSTGADGLVVVMKQL